MQVPPARPGRPAGDARRRLLPGRPPTAFLPRGRRLGADAWRARHRGLTVLLWLHVPALLALGVALGRPVGEALVLLAPVCLAGSVAVLPRLRRDLRSAATSLGLVMTASTLVHLWGGVTEAHFHYFVIIAFLTLYQAWLPFLVALGYVVAEHGVIGMLDPGAVWVHHSGQHAWVWAVIHGGFVLAASLANLLSWRLTETEALRDALTGLPNRTLLLDSLTESLRRRPTRTAVVLLDLDGFKNANDAFGHDVGDEALRTLSARFCAQVGQAGLLARLGGDEFAVVLAGEPTGATTRDLAERLGRAAAEPIPVGNRSLVLGASLGVATSADGARSAEDLLRDADLAMYEAKRRGRRQVAEFSAGLREEAVRLTELEAELRTAVDTGQLVVHYQPIVDTRSRRDVAVEALVRWQHPVRGLVPPGDFIPVAERCGLIGDLGAWVLLAACREVGAWRDATGLVPVRLAVNLSPRQLADPGVVDMVADTLRRSGFPAERLTLEITEDSLIQDFEVVLRRLGALRSLGVGLALDDFGTGYSSLGYLRRLPVSTVKLDRSFVTGVDPDSPSARIIEGVTRLVHSLGMSVTAEGVETPQEADLVRSLGVDLAQGWLFGRPVAWPEASVRFRAGSPDGSVAIA